MDRDFQTETGYERIERFQIGDPSHLHSHQGLEFIYQSTRGNIKEIWGEQPHTPTVGPDEIEDLDSCVGVTNYRYRLIFEPSEEKLWRTWGDGWSLVASGTDIMEGWKIEWPDGAPVCGDVCDDEDITVWYMTNRGNLRSIEMHAEFVEGGRDSVSVTGYHDGDRVKFRSDGPRIIQNDRKMGHVARVEFPRGVRITVDVEGRRDIDPESIKRHLENYTPWKKSTEENTPDVTVSCDPLEWPDT